MPSSGRTPPPCTDAASSEPTNGPTQANEVSENVSPMSSVPSTPPFCEARSRLVRMPDGMVISKAPSRLSPKTKNTSAMKPLTHGFEPSCTTPNGPEQRRGRSPRPENSTMMPRQKTMACVTLSRRDPDCRFRKNDMVIGIMGKTQGVKMVSSPKPKATARNGARSPEAAVAVPAAASTGADGRLGISGGNGGRGGGGGGIDGQGRGDVLGDRRDAMRGVAHLVAGLQRDLDRSGGGILFQLQPDQEDHRAFVGLEFLVEAGVERALRRGLQQLEFSDGRRLAEFQRAGDVGILHRREGIHVPAGIDARFQASQHGGAGSGGRGIQRERPLHQVFLGEGRHDGRPERQKDGCA